MSTNDWDGWSGWQSLLNQDENRCVLHEPGFMRILETIYKCQAVPQVIETPHGDLGVPAFKVKSLLSGRKITSMPFNFYPGLLNGSDDLCALRHLVTLAVEQGPAWYVEYKSFSDLATNLVIRGHAIHRTMPSMVSRLILKNSYDEQRSGYRRSLRQNLRTTFRKAEDLGVRFRKAESLSDVAAFYKVLCLLYRRRHRMLPQPAELFRQLFLRLVPDGQADFYLALRDDEILAGVVVLKSARAWEYSWAASDLEHRFLGLNTLLVDRLVQDAIAAGANVLGFGSSSPSDRKLLYFKARWGCEHRAVRYYYWKHHPKVIDLETSYSTVRAALPYIPTPVLRLLSTHIVPMLA